MKSPELDINNINKTIQLQNTHISYHHCLHDAIAMIALYYEESYEAMYKNAWLFDYNTNNREVTFGQRINWGRIDNFEGLEMINALKVKYNMFNTIDEMKQFIKKEIDARKPTCMYIDAYVCPWNPAYQQHHITHYALVTGISGDMLVCNDPFLSKENELFNINQLTTNFIQCISVECKERKKVNDTNSLLLKRALQDIEEMYSFDKMKQMAKELGSASMLDEIFTNCKDIDSQILIRKINSVSIGRVCFSIFLRKLYPNVIDNDITKNFEWCSEHWNMVNSMLIRAFLRDRYERYAENIEKEIIQICEIETRIFDSLKNRLKESGI